MDYNRPVKYSTRMVRLVRNYTLAGLTTNADFARILRSHTGMPIRADDIARWRRQHWEFDDACSTAADHMIAMAVGVIATKIEEGDDANARWFLERRAQAFMPKISQKLTGPGGTLDDILSRRGELGDAEMRARGLIADEDGSDDVDKA